MDASATLTRYAVAFFASLPVAALLAADIALCFGEKDLAYGDQVIRASFVVGWIVLTISAARNPTAKAAFRQSCFMFSAVAFLLPVAAIVFAVTEPASRDPIFPSAVIVVVCFILGGGMGILGLLVARFVRDEPETSGRPV